MIKDKANKEIIEKKFISINAAAELLGVSYTTIWLWITQKIIPSYRIGNVIRLDKEELIEGFKSGKFDKSHKETKQKIIGKIENKRGKQ